MIRHILTLLCFLLYIPCTALAHFGMVIPETNLVKQDKKEINIELSFSHPFELIGMELTRPERFSAICDGQTSDLTDQLTTTSLMDYQGWKLSYRFKRPQVCQFVMEPKPYWEKSEDVSIIHYTKTIVAAFGGDEGWDQEAGLPTEIIPLTRPFGNYAGNSFSAQVLVDGKPAPGAEVEVEYYNRDGSLKAASDYHVTQVVKADNNGIFHFSCPLPGWWGFAALSEADYTLKDPDGEEKGVELGAVLWIYMDAYSKKTTDEAK